jgi:hypothetical protein
MAAGAPTPLDYNGFVTALALLAAAQTITVSGVIQGQDVNFTNVIPQCLNYAELRIQRDADLQPSLSSKGYTLSTGANIFSVPVGDFVTIQTLFVNGAPLTPVAKEWLQNVYPPASSPGPPLWFSQVGGDLATAGQTSTQLMLGPPPDQTYPATIFGTIRLPTLAVYGVPGQATGNYTFISQWLPDLLLMAAMVFISAYQRNFSAAADDPNMPVNYEQQYQKLLAGVQTEEARKRFAASGWSAMSQPVAATASR